MSRAQTPAAARRDLGPHPGYYAVSVNYLRGHTLLGAPDGCGGSTSIATHAYAYFRHFRPVAKAGYTFFIYHVTRDEANRVRAHLGLPLLHDAVPRTTPDRAGGES